MRAPLSYKTELNTSVCFLLLILLCHLNSQIQPKQRTEVNVVSLSGLVVLNVDAHKVKRETESKEAEGHVS